METVETSNVQAELTPVQKLKKYLDTNDIRYRRVYSALGLSPAWMTGIFKGHMPLTPERQKQIEELLDIKL